MSEYPRTGSYRGSMYEHGIDAKIVIMGNTGQSPSALLPWPLPPHPRPSLLPQAWGRLACCNDIPRTNSTPRTRHPQPEHFSSRRRSTRTGSRSDCSCGTRPVKKGSEAWYVVSQHLLGIMLIISTSLFPEIHPSTILMRYERHPCITAAQMPHYSCTILRTLRPLKTSAVGWKVCTFPVATLVQTAWLSRVLTTACRAKKELFTGPHHLHRRCQIRFNSPTTGHV